MVSGPVELPAPAGVELVRVISAAEMFEAAAARFPECHAAVMTAAVCDYRPEQCGEQKLKKQDRPLDIRLVPTRDICAYLGQTKGSRVVVGFAMEDHDHRANAEAKMRRKHCDAMVLNGLGNVGGELAEIEILRADTGWSPAISGTKTEVAARVVDLVETLARQDG